ncbi:MAG TPA: lamin tail domain-containing protein, partial [Myxococcota bacterium]|nr:lamin tail domain-containing protein [Myxococcota bacterium]
VDEDFVDPGDILVVEIMADPAAVSDVYGEYFELYNTSSLARDLMGWRIFSDDGNEIVIRSSLPIAPGAYLTFGVESDPTRNGGVSLDYVYSRSDFSLSSSDSFFIEANGTIIAELNYDSSWGMLPGYALGLDPYYYSSSALTDGSRWCSQDEALAAGDYGSPGQENRYCPSFDHDGDGYSTNDGDCDDRDGEQSPGAGERLDGQDNDCDGVVDQYIMSEDNTAFVVGDYGNYLTYRYSLGTGDLDGDGAVELVVGGLYGGGSDNGVVYVLEGADYAGWAGPAGDDAEATATGSSYGLAAVLSQRMEDNSGDGVADLVVAGSDTYAGSSGLENLAVY